MCASLIELEFHSFIPNLYYQLYHTIYHYHPAF